MARKKIQWHPLFTRLLRPRGSIMKLGVEAIVENLPAAKRRRLKQLLADK